MNSSLHFRDPQHLTGIFTDKPSFWYEVQGTKSPAFVIRLEHLEVELQTPLDHSVPAVVAALTQDSAFENWLSTLRF